MYSKVTLRPRDIKSMARQMLKGQYLHGLFFLLLVSIITEAPGIIFSGFSQSFGGALLLDAYSLVIAGPISVGVASYFIAIFRSRPKGADYTLFGNGNFGETVKLYLLCALRIILKSFLLIVPGIIESFRLSMVYHIMADDPTKGAAQCIRESCEMMDGNKTQFLFTEISFWLWYVLACTPMVILLNTYAPGPFATIEEQYAAYAAATGQPLYLLASLLPIFADVYRLTANACFYDFAAGNIIMQNENTDNCGIYNRI